VSQSYQGGAQQAQRPSQSQSGEPLELTMWHAAFFVIVASGLLLLLFFFQFYTAVTVLYGFACSGAMSQLIFRPVLGLGANRLGCSDHFNNAICPKVLFCGLGEISALDVLAGLAGYLIGFTWLVVWFTSNDPSSQPYYWIIQNVMGACICILFLKILRLNSIKVATVLLIAVFIYDIFFVFLSPYIFGGESVMVTVATGGGTEVSADFCQKYPSDSRCRDGQPLPMLLTIPRINDFRGGSSLLGLGDIVLPGLLISFAARLDEAKYLVGGHTNVQIRMPPKHGGFLLYLVIAYAVGLLMANIAVVLMERGQPALMYLVPTTLGTFLFLGRHELKDLWQGPRVLSWADRLVRYGDNNSIPHADDAATVAESVDDVDFDQDGDGVAATTGTTQASSRVGRTVGGSTRELV
jgi:signal peptide peptidase-like protein 2B